MGEGKGRTGADPAWKDRKHIHKTEMVKVGLGLGAGRLCEAQGRADWGQESGHLPEGNLWSEGIWT